MTKVNFKYFFTFPACFSGWLLVLVVMGKIWEECNTSRELMSYLYPLMYLELMCVIGVHPAFNIYIRELVISSLIEYPFNASQIEKLTLINK